MQKAYTLLGELTAQKPYHFILGGLLLIFFCLLGLTRFKLETNPQQLWVGPGSRAAQDKAAYEASFGPFYRVAQLILSTTPQHKGDFISTTGLPAIVNDANIQLLFDMQDLVNNVTVCFKPFGTVCATQSILQFWHMDRSFYLSEQAKSRYATKLSPDYCFGHWYTQCRSAFEAPMDPHVILGGFSTGPDFRNYSADATAFVVTYPIDSNPGNLAAALAWESAFIQLAKGPLSKMAAAANLSLAFQAERSVEDELKRESYTDASVVAVSYLVMLVYIALALAALPPPRQLQQLFVLSRASLGAGGVLIVAGSVAGALGLCSMMGMWSTLIIMEVIPFLVLAVGVDNMFVLAHALSRQDAALPLVTRSALALGSAGPSITLAASCEVLAFGLGALTPMPAVRNFSLCAATAVLLDFLLQVSEAALSPASSYIASPAASWLDDFLSWINPSLNKCCRLSPAGSPQLGPAGSRCPPPDQPPCSANVSACGDCQVCLAELPGGRPQLEQVERFLPWFLQSSPSVDCAKGGAGAYNNALQKDQADLTGIAGLSQGVITSSAFRTYHTALNAQQDFIGALSAARAFTETASKELGLELYPYSVFHIFFEQYLNVKRDALLLVGLPLLAVFSVAWLFTGSLWGSLILLGMLISLMLQLAGAMRLAGIEVNAVSLVNLAMALGIAVEFCAHILHSFCVSHGSRVARAKAALVKMGAPVTSGITLTKFAGVVVLAFARTQIFE
eukprot:gene1814-2147_t